MTDPVSDAYRTTIRNQLTAIAREEDATILFAIESGSRAWGFHSPDSDYDVRFIYTRPVDWHLQVAPGRDVIERPISNELDLSGWDLRKTLSLILGSNAVALEWLQSPITYVEEPGFRDAMTAFARQSLRRVPVMWHYRRLAERQMERQTNPDGSLRLKRYFYTIRPILALRWLRLRPDAATPPMDMARLMADCDLPEDVHAAILDLIEQKKTLSETGNLMQPPALTDRLIADELQHAVNELATATEDHRPDTRDQADALLAEWTRKYDPTAKELTP